MSFCAVKMFRKIFPRFPASADHFNLVWISFRLTNVGLQGMVKKKNFLVLTIHRINCSLFHMHRFGVKNLPDWLCTFRNLSLLVLLV